MQKQYKWAVMFFVNVSMKKMPVYDITKMSHSLNINVKCKIKSVNGG